jgi:hypothetical protein
MAPSACGIDFQDSHPLFVVIINKGVHVRNPAYTAAYALTSPYSPSALELIARRHLLL